VVSGQEKRKAGTAHHPHYSVPEKFFFGGTGFPACAKAAGQSCTAWKGCATSFHA
jgi:hypothetical protein